MKKHIIVSLLFIAVSSIATGFCSQTAFAASKPVAYVIGYVFPPRNNPYDASDLKVEITCLNSFTGHYTGSGTDTTDASGSFLVIIPVEQCPRDSRIIGNVGDKNGLHYGHSDRFANSLINTKLILYEGSVRMLW